MLRASPSHRHRHAVASAEERLLARLPNVAIHMNHEVNEQGLKLNKQTELPLILAMLDDDQDAGAHDQTYMIAALAAAFDS